MMVPSMRRLKRPRANVSSCPGGSHDGGFSDATAFGQVADHRLDGLPSGGDRGIHQAGPAAALRRSTSLLEVRTTWITSRRNARTAAASAVTVSPTSTAMTARFHASAETSVMRSVTSSAAVAVSVTLRAISAVAAPCCSTAAAIEPAIALISAMVCSIRATAATEAAVADRTCAMCRPISSVERAVWLASASPRLPPRRSPCRHPRPARPRSWHSAPADWCGTAISPIMSATAPMRATSSFRLSIVARVSAPGGDGAADHGRGSGRPDR